ncbi:hypothetical protein GCM10028807_34960 [Spirosoma daeguense]
MSQLHHQLITLNMSFSENDTFALAELLVTIAKNLPITDKQRELAAILFVKMDKAAKNTTIKINSTSIRADLRPAPYSHRRKKKGRR